MAAVHELPAALQEALRSSGLLKAFLLKAYPRASPAALGLSGEFADWVRKALRSRSCLFPAWDMSLGDHTPVDKFEALLDPETGVNPSVSKRTQQIGLIREPVWLQQTQLNGG